MAVFERSRGSIDDLGLSLEDPRGQLALQQTLRANGYPDAVVVCQRSVEDALAHEARCLVRRDG
jgi:hypothetical protein